MALNVDQLIADLIRDEGCKLKVYKCPAGRNSVGIGRNLDDLGLSDAEEIFLALSKEELLAGASITESGARYLLRNDIKRCTTELDVHCPWWTSMPEPAQRALMNMNFNMGWTKLSAFKLMLGALKDGLYAAAAFQAQNSDWFKQVKDRGPRVVALYQSCAKAAA